MQRHLTNWGRLTLLAAAIILADQVTKEWVVNNMTLGQSIVPIPALETVFRFTRSYNTGAAFGLGAGASDLFLFISLGIVLFLLYLYPRTPEDAWVSKLATGVVIGGAMGNILDRLQHGVVVDFIHYRIPGVISNVSNLADHAIVIGVVLLALDNWRRDRLEQEKANMADAANTETTIIEKTIEPE